MQKSVKKQIYRDAFRFIWLPIFISIASLCLENLLLIRYAEIFGDFANAVFAFDVNDGMELIDDFVIAFILTVIAVPTINFIGDVIMVKCAMTHDRMVLSRFLDKRCDAIGKVDAGDMLNRLNDDPNELRLELHSICTESIIIPVTMVYLIVNALKAGTIYFLVVFAVSLIKFIIPVLIRKAEKKYHRENKEYASATRSDETDFSCRAHLINLFGMSQAMIDRQDARYVAFFYATKRKSIRLENAANTVRSFTNMVCMLVVLLTGAYFVSVDQITPGAVAAMLGYYAVLNKIIDNFCEFIRKLPIIDNLAKRLTYFYEDAEPNVGKRISKIGAFYGNNLRYSYGDNQIFGPVSFTIHNGKKVVVCGKNGGGKSTMMKVLLSVLNGYDGSLKVDGTELSEIKSDIYRGLISYAPQDPYLFRGTVIENVILAKTDVNINEVRHLMSEYGILSLADREIGEGGYELSGGEKQKISIVRAIIKDTPVVFIDEPENNLDALSLENLRKWICESNKTIIYISHHSDFVACANQKIEL